MFQIAFVVCGFASVVKAWELSASEVLARAFENERRQQVARSQYFFRERAERRETSRDQKPGRLNFTHSYEWVYLEGEPFRKLVAVNDVPLRGKKAEEEDRRMRMTAAERRAAAAANKPNSRIISVGNVQPSELLHVLHHTLEGEEVIAGRSASLIRSEPRRALKGDRCGESKAECYRYTFWIDQQDLVIVQQKYEVIAHGTEALPGTWSKMTYSRVGNGPWLRTRMEGYFVTGPPRPAAKWWQLHTFSDHRKFDAVSTVVLDEKN